MPQVGMGVELDRAVRLCVEIPHELSKHKQGLVGTGSPLCGLRV
jgi:hypothetical protein